MSAPRSESPLLSEIPLLEFESKARSDYAKTFATSPSPTLCMVSWLRARYNSPHESTRESTGV